MAVAHTKEFLLSLLEDYETEYGELPTRRELREVYGVSENPYVRIFGSWTKALEDYKCGKNGNILTQPSDTCIGKGTVAEQLQELLGEDTLRTILKSAKGVSPIVTVPSPDLPTTGHFKALFCTDTHIGHKCFNETWWWKMIENAEKHGVDFMWHGGDILEGMSGRPGHVYELSHIGFEAQFDYACKLMEAVPYQIRAITGNHDGWYTGKGDIGLDVGKRMEQALPDTFVNLGADEADEVIDGVKVKLWHGCDGASYALCHDDKTEVLTPEGWVLFENLKKGEPVATLNPDSHYFEWQVPTAYTADPYKGELLHFKARCIDMMVTPNHRMYVRRCPSDFENKRTAFDDMSHPTKSHRTVNFDWGFMDAKDCWGGVKQKYQMTKVVSGWEGTLTPAVTVPYRESINTGVKVRHLGEVDIKDMAELIAWYVTEGHIKPGKGILTISQYQKVNPENYDKIRKLIIRLGLTPHERERNTIPRAVSTGSMELCNYLISECGHLSRNKFLPKWLKNQPTEILRIVFDTMIAGDGWITSTGFGYRSLSEQLKDDFAEIALKLGYGATFSGTENVNIVSTQVYPAINNKPLATPYTGTVYCVTVPNGIIMTRRNGKTIWGGNSYRCQKFVENLTGGEKPHILLSGHAHKSCFFQYRNVQVIEGGTLSAQSKFMRGKKLAAHAGYWILDVYTNKQGLESITPMWFPFY